MLELLFLLLPVAAGYGWIMGRNSVRQAQRKQSSILSKHYYKGLNFLLSDQPDKAVDTLIKMININSDTSLVRKTKPKLRLTTSLLRQIYGCRR